MFRIAGFARLCGVTPKMLRDYDRLGIFQPVWVDRTTGYRMYSPAQLPEIRRILALRDLGVGLDEIGRLVIGRADLPAVLLARRAALEQDRREIDRRLAALEISVETGVVGAGGGPGRLDLVVRRVESESVATLDATGIGLERAFYELEAYIRDAGRRASRPPGALIHEIAVSPGDVRRVEAFVPLRGHLAPNERIATRRLSACRAATIISRGPYDTLAAARSDLGAWVAASGLRVAGPLRVVYLQFGAESELKVPAQYVVQRDADFVTELQLPVEHEG